MVRFGAFLIAFAAAAQAQAGVLLVDAQDTGGFGRLSGTTSSGGSNFVQGWTFTGAGQTISLTATGSINLSNALPNNGPNGIPVTIDGSIVTTSSYTPLEQQYVAAGTISIPRPLGTVLQNEGALIGAFVPASLAGSPGFVARDPSTVQSGQTGLPAQDVNLLLGTQATFTSPGAGVLYLGINDLYAPNNFDVTPGGFTVTINAAAVPEPGPMALLGSGVAAAAGMKLWKSRKRPA